MDTILLLRSYGDFIIALYHLTDHHALNRHAQIVASKHLEPLHQSIFPFLNSAQQNISFEELGVKHHLFSGFTNRYLFTMGNWKELQQLKFKTQDFAGFTLEQKRRAWLVRLTSRKSVDFVHAKGNIYDSWSRFYNHENLINDLPLSIQRVLIFPDSRMQKKIIPETVLQKLESELKKIGITVNRSYFKRNGENDYKNFVELTQLIQSSDYIISSDSLPAHMAQLFQKPHAIIYNTIINEEWITPFAKKYQTGITGDTILMEPVTNFWERLHIRPVTN